MKITPNHLRNHSLDPLLIHSFVHSSQCRLSSSYVLGGKPDPVTWTGTCLWSAQSDEQMDSTELRDVTTSKGVGRRRVRG